MAAQERRLISVRTDVVLSAMVESLVEDAARRATAPLDEHLEAALGQAAGALGDAAPAAPVDASALAQVARLGWAARHAELERFEVARERRPGWPPGDAPVAGDLAAAAAWCAALAAREPLARPDPDDPAAASWRVPGPGGHARHYVALRAIGSTPDAVAAAREAGMADPTALKRVWLFGFLMAEVARP